MEFYLIEFIHSVGLFLNENRLNVKTFGISNIQDPTSTSLIDSLVIYKLSVA